MAVTLTPDEQEIVHFSFPIVKTEEEDGDLRVFGKCTDGSVDRDMERVDVDWSQSALKNWLDSGGNVRLQHDSKRPIGKGLKLDFSPDGHYLTALVVDRDAKELARKGILTAYSVGITRPDFAPDPTGKAVRVITGRKDGTTEVAEVSLVDRPSNRNCGITLCKRAADGTPEYVGKVFGADDLLIKEARDTEDAPAEPAAAEETVRVEVPKSASITFSPSDLSKLLEHRRVAEEREEQALTAIKAAEVAVWKRDIDTATRRRLASQGRALPNLSYPIETHEDADNAVTLALSGHGDVGAAKALIRRIARKEGWQDILDRLDGKDGDSAGKAASAPAKPGRKCKLCKGKGKIRGGNLTCPRCHGDGVISPREPGEHGKSTARMTARQQEAAVKAITAAQDFALAVTEAQDAGLEVKGAAVEQADPQADPQAGVTKAGDDDDAAALHHDDGEDDDTDSDADAMDKAALEALCAKYAWTPEQAGTIPADALAALVAAEKTAAPDMTKPPKAACTKCGKKNKASAKFCTKCGSPMGASKAGDAADGAEKASKPTPGEGVTGAAESSIQAAPEHREPDGPAIEALEHDADLPTVPDAGVMQAKVAEFHRGLGVPHEAGWLHDLLCPAYDPATAKAAHPLASLDMIDDLAWQARALDTAASAPLEEARQAAFLWQHARTVKAIPPDLAGELTAEAHKAFRDANPGPGTAPVPGEIPASRFIRPYITAGHAAPSPGQGAPHQDPVHAGHISAQDFRRDLITAGHEADSPGNASPRPAPVPAPEVPGVPSRTYYTRVQRDNARQAMTAMHDHISRIFPDICPMHTMDPAGPAVGQRPIPAGAGGPVPHGASTKASAAEEVPGEITASGRAAQQLAAAKAARLERKLRKARREAGLEVEVTGAAVTLEKAAGVTGLMDPDLIKSAVTEAASSLVADLRAELAAAREQITEQGEMLAKQARRLKDVQKTADAIADQPDPSVTAYRGVALAGVPKTTAAAQPSTLAQHAERAQVSLFNAMHEQWRTASSPEEREYAWKALKEMTGLMST